jgi:tRNA (cytidine/uridine-2'-O-)-methyltransferase
MDVILYQPQIPQNTGNIVRTCAVTGSNLILVRPLGFAATDRWLKRAGLDYWDGVNVIFIDDLESFLDQTTKNFYFFSSKVSKPYSSINFNYDDLLIFGSETSGLPEIFFQKWPDRFITIPMVENVRCLNLATSVGIGLYEAWRQQHFTYSKIEKKVNLA